MHPVFAQIAFLTRLCVRGRGGKLGLVLFAAVFGLGLLGVQVSIRLIAWTADFYNALQRLDVDEAVRQIGIFFGLIGISASLFLVASFLRKLLQIRWRQALTEAALDRWLAGKAYWHLRDRVDSGLDNPDQRVAEDCRIFVDKLTGEAIELMTNIVALVSYVAILWSLSTFPLAFTVAGTTVEIPRYMVWAAPIYVALASGLTHWLGSPLKALAFEQQRREADFRFALTRLREQVEAVALMGGEAVERRQFAARFAEIRRNWLNLAHRELILGCFTRPYFQTVLRIPLFLALPAFLAGKLTFGGLMQMGSAFQNVVTTLSWFIFSYRDLAELAAASGRLWHFLNAAEAGAAAAGGPSLTANRSEAVALSDVRLTTPDGRALAAIPDLHLTKGQNCWIEAPSGHGKSTLVKALAGLWRHGAGSIARPDATMLALPQQPYLPLGGLRDARPHDGEMRIYQRAYVSQQQADSLYLSWGRCMAHALLLEQDPGRIYEEYGDLNGRQLGEGARCAARRFALILAEPPAMSAAILELKIAVYEAMARDEDEWRRSRAATMVEIAMVQDARDLGIVLTKVPLGVQSDSGSH